MVLRSAPAQLPLLVIRTSPNSDCFFFPFCRDTIAYLSEFKLLIVVVSFSTKHFLYQICLLSLQLRFDDEETAPGHNSKVKCYFLNISLLLL